MSNQNNQWENIPTPEIVPVTPGVENGKVPSINDIYGDRDAEDIIREQEKKDKRDPFTQNPHHLNS